MVGKGKLAKGGRHDGQWYVQFDEGAGRIWAYSSRRNQTGASEAVLMMNLLHQVSVDFSMASGGVYAGKGMAPVPQKLAE